MRRILHSTWLKAFALAGVMEVLSLTAFHHDAWAAPALILTVLAATLFAFRDLRYPLAILMVEAVAGSHGRFFAVEVGGFDLSVRMALFGVLVTAWVIHVLRGCSRILHFPHARVTGPLLFIIGMVTWGLVRAWSVGTPLSEAVSDADGYAFIVLIPIMLDLVGDRKSFAWIGKVITGALLWLSVKSLLLLYAFSHVFPFHSELYVWQRQAWLTEITRLESGIYRIFAASDVFLLFGVLVGFMLLWQKPSRARWTANVLFGSAFILSLSRSFWLGAAAATAFMVPVLARLKLLTRKTAAAFAGRGFAVFAVSLGLLFATVMMPVPERLTDGSSFGAFGARFGIGDAAVSSRWNMLGPLGERIRKHPILGSGFGRAITYRSDDPRIHDLYPGGVITTTAIEWQYLEMMMKMGLFALVAVVWLWWRIGAFFWGAMRSAEGEDRRLLAGLMMAFLAFIVANVFTPYMNHPLGWVFLSIVIAGLHAVREGEVENAPVHAKV